MEERLGPLWVAGIAEPSGWDFDIVSSLVRYTSLVMAAACSKIPSIAVGFIVVVAREGIQYV